MVGDVGLLVDTDGVGKVRPGRSRLPAKIKKAKVVLCSSAKGGSGKSTSVRSLATFAAKEGLRVATVDLDAQQTLTRWWLRRPDNLPSITNYDAIPMADASEAVGELAASGDYDVILVDTAPGVEKEVEPLKHILGRSDLVLVPTTDGGEDLESVADWMATLRREKRPAYFLLCKTDRGMGTVGEARTFLSNKGRICPIDVRTMQAIKRSYVDGRGPADFTSKPGLRAAEDYRAVWNFVKLELGMGD